jgi:ABC-type transporter Mla MlaB component
MAVGPFDGKTVFLSGPITIYEVTTVREVLRKALSEERPLRIDVSEAGPWDIAGLQLLVSCVKSGRSRNQLVRIANIPRVCAEIAQRSGLTEWLQSVAE